MQNYDIYRGQNYQKLKGIHKIQKGKTIIWLRNPNLLPTSSLVRLLPPQPLFAGGYRLCDYRIGTTSTPAWLQPARNCHLCTIAPMLHPQSLPTWSSQCTINLGVQLVVCRSPAVAIAVCTLLGIVACYSRSTIVATCSTVVIVDAVA